MNQVQNNLNKEDNSQQNNTGNMYSYQDDNNNINNQNELEAGAIRRSLGQGNPNANYSQPYYNPEYNQNPNDMNINGGNVEIGQSQTYNNNFNNSNNSNNDIYKSGNTLKLMMSENKNVNKMKNGSENRISEKKDDELRFDHNDNDRNEEDKKEEKKIENIDQKWRMLKYI